METDQHLALRLLDVIMRYFSHRPGKLFRSDEVLAVLDYFREHTIEADVRIEHDEETRTLP